MTCRVCGAPTDPVLDLGHQSLANDFVAEADLELPGKKYPLRVRCCRGCLLHQLDTVVPPDLMFRHYPFRTGTTPTLRAHMRSIAETFGGRGRRILEIGSNDGALLREFKGTGSEVLGFEPAANIAAIAQAEGLTTRVDFFREGVCTGEPVDVVVARNVMAHCPDLNGFVRACRCAMKPSGALVVEAPWLASLFEGPDGFSQTYHEHAASLGVASMRNLFARHGMKVVRTQFVDLHGGSLQYEVRYAAGRQESEIVERMEAREYAAGCYNEPGWRALQHKADLAKGALLDLLGRMKEKGLRYGGYCASAKGSVMLQWAGVTTDLLPWVCDWTPEKQGLCMPGTLIPVISPAEMKERQPDVLLVLAANWKSDILSDPTLKCGLVTPGGEVWR